MYCIGLWYEHCFNTLTYIMYGTSFYTFIYCMFCVLKTFTMHTVWYMLVTDIHKIWYRFVFEHVNKTWFVFEHINKTWFVFEHINKTWFVFEHVNKTWCFMYDWMLRCIMYGIIMFVGIGYYFYVNNLLRM